MKYFAVVLLAACAAAAVAAVTPPRPQALALRESLEQYHPQLAPAPRQLSAQERDELRKQLRELRPPEPRRTYPPSR